MTAEFGYALLIAPELLLIACRLAGSGAKLVAAGLVLADALLAGLRTWLARAWLARAGSIGKPDCQMDALALLLQHIVAYEPHALLSKGDSIVLRYVEEALCH